MQHSKLHRKTSYKRSNVSSIVHTIFRQSVSQSLPNIWSFSEIIANVSIERHCNRSYKQWMLTFWTWEYLVFDKITTTIFNWMQLCWFKCITLVKSYILYERKSNVIVDCDIKQWLITHPRIWTLEFPNCKQGFKYMEVHKMYVCFGKFQWELAAETWYWE